jgi:hypothetical protein
VRLWDICKDIFLACLTLGREGLLFEEIWKKRFTALTISLNNAIICLPFDSEPFSNNILEKILMQNGGLKRKSHPTQKRWICRILPETKMLSLKFIKENPC